MTPLSLFDAKIDADKDPSADFPMISWPLPSLLLDHISSSGVGFPSTEHVKVITVFSGKMSSGDVSDVKLRPSGRSTKMPYQKIKWTHSKFFNMDTNTHSSIAYQ